MLGPHPQASTSPAAATGTFTQHSKSEDAQSSNTAGRQLLDRSDTRLQHLARLGAVQHAVAVAVATGADGRPVLGPMSGPAPGTTADSDIFLMPPANGTVLIGACSKAHVYCHVYCHHIGPPQ